MMAWALEERMVEAVGWGLVHSVWELGVVGVLVWGGLRAVPRGWAWGRYRVGLVGMGAMVVCVAGTVGVELCAGHGAGREETRAVSDGAMVVVMEAGGERVASNGAGSGVQARAGVSWEAVVVGLYGVGVVACLMRLAGGWWALRQVKQGAQERAGLTAMTGELARRMGMGVARAAESVLVEVPVVVGMLRPIVVVPAMAVTGLSERELMALLAHELAHVRRWDPVINGVQCVMEAVLFYHPAVWCISGVVRAERECCCDEEAARAVGGRAAVAGALAAMEGLRGSVGGRVAIAARGAGGLTERVERLLGRERAVPGGSGWAVMTCVMGAVVAGGVYLAGCEARHGATAAAPEGVVTIAAMQRPLGEVLEEIGKQGGVAVEARWEKLAGVGAERETRVNVALSNVSVEAALQAAVATASGGRAGALAEGKRAVVSTLDDLHPGYGTVRAYAASAWGMCEPAPVGGTYGFRDWHAEERERGTLDATVGENVEAVKRGIEPGSWAQGKGTVEVKGGWVDVRQTETAQAEVAAFVERLRAEGRGLPAEIWARLVVAVVTPEGLAKARGVVPVEGGLATEGDARRAIKEMEAAGGKVMFDSQMGLRLKQAAWWAQTKQRNIFSGVTERVVEKETRTTMEVSTVTWGLRVGLRLERSADGRYVVAGAETEWRQLAGIDEFQPAKAWPAGAPADAKVQVPRVAEGRAKTMVSMPRGGGAFMSPVKVVGPLDVVDAEGAKGVAADAVRYVVVYVAEVAKSAGDGDGQ